MPAPPATCSLYATEAASIAVNHVMACGFVFPLKISMM